MARIEVHIDSVQLARETEALARRMQVSERIRAQVAQLTLQGVATVEMFSVPARRGKALLRQQLSEPYWQILEQEAV